MFVSAYRYHRRNRSFLALKLPLFYFRTYLKPFQYLFFLMTIFYYIKIFTCFRKLGADPEIWSIFYVQGKFVSRGRLIFGGLKFDGSIIQRNLSKTDTP